VADQICLTTSVTPGSRSPTSTTASNVAANPAAIKAATAGARATDVHNTGNTPATVRSAIATRFRVDGSRTSAPTMAKAAAIAQPPASHASLPSPMRAATNAINSGKVGAAIRAACSQTQSLPSCTSSEAAEMASMNAISSIVMPSLTIGASTISGTSTSRPS
jgi:hypothetical protein